MLLIKSLLCQSKYLILLSVFFILLTSFAAFIYASVLAGHLLWELLTHNWFVEKIEFQFVEVIERFLTAITLLILAMGLYELFIQPLKIASPLRVHSFHELKSNLGNVILLNMVVIFFGDLAEDQDALALLWKAVAITLISGILILFSQKSSAHALPTDPKPE
ncbi:YqhA family protein [Synechocystis sp. LKSZ1]|uniref:YqhA family protein n=1 Tax=Synechocystis sp. LKSZ1 TaxID=3144951 RepID=UPI00336BC657